MYVPIAIWGFLIILVIAVGGIADNIYILVNHVFVQASADAAADAGANQRQLTFTSDDMHEFVIEPITATTAGQASFNKNMQNMESMNMDTSKIDEPVISFPDQYTMQVDVEFSHNMGFSETVLNNTFDSDTSFEEIEDSVSSSSDINHRK